MKNTKNENIEIESVPTEVAIHLLKPAAWNPRPTITAESVADLTASIRKVGLLERIVVCKVKDGYMVIAGHRRLKACEEAGMTEVPVEIKQVDETMARRMTFIENLQRKDVDPIMEAGVIESLLSSGMTIEEIAAESGRSVGWVAMRKQLLQLVPEWKEMAGKIRIMVDALERVSRYEPKVQRNAYKALKFVFKNVEREGGELRWRTIERDFAKQTTSLLKVKFDTAPCEKCPCNSAVKSELFPELADETRDGLGRCENAACYVKNANAAMEMEIARFESRGILVKRVAHSYDAPDSWALKRKFEKKNPICYVWNNSNGIIEYGFGHDKKAPKRKLSATEKLQAQEERRKKRNVKTCQDQIVAWLEAEGHKDLVRRLICDDSGAVVFSNLVMLITSWSLNYLYVLDKDELDVVGGCRQWVKGEAVGCGSFDEIWEWMRGYFYERWRGRESADLAFRVFGRNRKEMLADVADDVREDYVAYIADKFK